MVIGGTSLTIRRYYSATGPGGAASANLRVSFVAGTLGASGHKRGAEYAMTPVDRHIGRRIRGKRRALGLSQSDLAQSLGIGSDAIEGYERGTLRVPAEHLIKLAEVFGVSVSYFFPTGPCPKP